jgi:3-oxoacyl-[acyl-carrier protein] reductase
VKPGSTILIAGSRQGVGRALAEHYAHAGHSVFGISRNASDFAHAGYRHFCADVSKDETLKSAFQQMAQTSPLQVLIYSAAVYMPAHALLLSGGKAEEMLRTNLLGAFLVSRHALRLMKRGGFGRLIYLSSIAVPLGSAGSAVYGASKAGVEQLAFSMSRDFVGDDITFNAIGISMFASPMLDSLTAKALEQAKSALVKPEAVGVDELVAAIDFFSSHEARQITGQTIYFGGVR